ncbi:S9 family peptidase [Desmospora profundinema]|uniref:Dipeptidyl aminopeptidase/acylaminoacyl peptidase n=1 Tax=Desmospora profundinema TaxID=1571184 RepID=A0ABU1IIY1_9BACL|nr:S9 family peptidase [Desmospora profundinema]MDR6224711.1 dipeptidyl aminopeptidase/acylaminoacyl peptidase [Desmospora profundinema]
MISFSKPDVEQFFRTLIIQNFAVSPDEKQLIFSTNLGGTFDLWGMDLPRTFPYPLTFHSQSSHGIHFDKQGRFIIASFDHDGDEFTQLYALPPQGGESKPLRVQKGERHFFGGLSQDGARLYYTSTKGNPTYLNTYCYDLKTGEENLLLKGEKGATTLIDVSPDETAWLFGTHFANTHTLAFVYKEGEKILLTPLSEAQHTVSDALFISETEVYLLTDYDADFSYLAHFNLETRTFTKLLSLEKESFTTLKLDKKQNCLYLVGSSGVEDRLYRYAITQGNLNRLESPVDVIEQLTVSESGNIYLLGRSATLPFNLFRLKKDAKEWTPLTDFKVPGVPREELIEPEVFTYPSHDGLEIEGLYFRANPETNNGHLILWPHGGPQAAERKMFRALFQFLLNRGYSILAPNFRGSSGYGLSFMKKVEGDWGHGPRLDNVHALDYAIAQGWADKDKILLMGGSYGGYMALLLHGRHGEAFKAVVDIFGVSNLFSFVETVPDHWKPAMKQWVGDPEKDREKFIEDSPITYLDGMTKPMLVIQGANDPRVVQAESDQVVEALRKRGVEVEYLVLEDEGHGFSKKANEIEVYRRVLDFFDRHAIKAGTAAR